MLNTTNSPTILRAVAEIAGAAADAAHDDDASDDAVKLAQVAASATRKGVLGPAAIEDADFRRSLAQLRKTRDAITARSSRPWTS